MKTSPVPPFIKSILKLLLGTLIVLLLARCAMLFLLWESIRTDPMLDIVNALYIGTKFDIRMVVLYLIPVALVLGIPPLERRLAQNSLRRGLISIYGLVFFVAAFIYVVDFGWYFYMNQRVDATLFEFAGNPDIAGNMVWESYPVIPITLAMLVVTAAYMLFFGHVLRTHTATPKLGWKRRAGWTAFAFVGLFLLAYGQISSNLFPLRWSNAYFSTNPNMATLALNPIQNLRDTFKSSRGTRPDMEATRDSYARVAQWLRVDHPDVQKLDFVRHVAGTPVAEQKKPLNVVVIIMESLSFPKTSFAPDRTSHPDDPTPNLLALAPKSRYYPWFFAPTRTTARAIFTTMTGIPDVNRSGGTSSRNPALVDQAVMMNEFKGYEKFYMIGGSASWANIRGVLDHNVDGLHLLEEGAWEAPNVDVWGISDFSLFREAVGVFNNQTRPFVAVIQTAGYHRPYTIPDDNGGFQLKTPSEETLKNYGFTGVDEYNSMRFSDHALGEFFRLASREPWFKNTVFAIFGDHGLTDTPGNMSPGYEACGLHGYHTPMLIYAPGLTEAGLFEPGTDERPCGQPDIFPTLASLAGIPYRYNALGRNLLDPDTQNDARQFIGGSAESIVKLVEGGYCYTFSETEGMYDLEDPVLHNLIESEPERAAHMRQWAKDFYNISKYLLYNNKKVMDSEIEP